jgi:hypothetical protein
MFLKPIHNRDGFSPDCEIQSKKDKTKYVQSKSYN